MDEPLIEDEKKPFEAEGMAEEDILPDPDEQLMLHQGNGRVWLVKVRSTNLLIYREHDSRSFHLPRSQNI